jgi:hypothetical protein
LLVVLKPTAREALEEFTGFVVEIFGEAASTPLKSSSGLLRRLYGNTVSIRMRSS